MAPAVLLWPVHIHVHAWTIVCMCMHMCAHACMRACVCAHTHTHTHTENLRLTTLLLASALRIKHLCFLTSVIGDEILRSYVSVMFIISHFSWNDF